MARENYVAPELGVAAFNCPICQAYSYQEWHEVSVDINEFSHEEYYVGFFGGHMATQRLNVIRNRIDDLPKHVCSFSKCSHCEKYSIWEGPNMVHPNISIVEPPNSDMPEDIEAIYKEASSIVNLSAKSAAALLRLALEKLLIHVGAKKGSIDVMIQDLIEKDIITAAGSVRKALDTLRLIGNAGVHPTGINLDEDPNAAFQLFKVLNFVVEKLISEEKEMASIYALVPENKRENLDKRRGE